MKIDAEKLEKAIDGMSSVCDKGKREIKDVLSAGFGVEFRKGVIIVDGGVYSINGHDHLLCCRKTANRTWAFYDLRDPKGIWTKGETADQLKEKICTKDYKYLGKFSDLYERKRTI